MLEFFRLQSPNFVLCLCFSILIIISSETSAQAPNPPVLVFPSDEAEDLTEFPVLEITASDNNSTNLTVRFYGKEAVPDNTFTIIGLPDTQYYSESNPEIFDFQTQWIVDNQDDLNIVYVAHVGDLVQNADDEGEWENADHSMSLLEDPYSPSYGIPYGTAVGNHDLDSDNSDMFNDYFGINRFENRNYYGGYYEEDNDNDNHYDFFSANGMDFMVIYIEYEKSDTVHYLNVISWAEDLLQTYSNRRAIIVAHRIIEEDGSWRETWGQALYDAFKDNSNVFLMLCGHYPGEAQRTDTDPYNGNTIYTLLAPITRIAVILVAMGG